MVDKNARKSPKIGFRLLREANLDEIVCAFAEGEFFESDRDTSATPAKLAIAALSRMRENVSTLNIRPMIKVMKPLIEAMIEQLATDVYCNDELRDQLARNHSAQKTFATFAVS